MVSLACLEKLLELTSKLWIQLFKSGKVLFCVGFPSHFCKEHSPVLIGLGHFRFELDSPIVMLKRLRIVLWALLPKREAEIIMRLSKVRIIADRLFEHSLSRSKLPHVHEIDASVVGLESGNAYLLLQRVADSRATSTATTSAAATASTATASTTTPRTHGSGGTCQTAYKNADKSLHEHFINPGSVSPRTGGNCYSCVFHLGVFSDLESRN